MSNTALISAVVSIGLALIFIMIKESNKSNEKLIEKSSFECGFLLFNAKKMTFSTNFITMIMLFIMFDVEVSIMIPMVMKSHTSSTEMTIPMAFLTALTMILMKEWGVGSMEWTK